MNSGRSLSRCYCDLRTSFLVQNPQGDVFLVQAVRCDSRHDSVSRTVHHYLTDQGCLVDRQWIRRYDLSPKWLTRMNLLVGVRKATLRYAHFQSLADVYQGNFYLLAMLPEGFWCCIT